MGVGSGAGGWQWLARQLTVRSAQLAVGATRREQPDATGVCVTLRLRTCGFGMSSITFQSRPTDTAAAPAPSPLIPANLHRQLMAPLRMASCGPWRTVVAVPFGVLVGSWVGLTSS